MLRHHPCARFARAAALGGALLGALIVGFVGDRYRRVRSPVPDPQPLPEGLVALDSPEGRALLASATARADLDSLLSAFRPQEQQHWAGVAATATVVSALTGSTLTQQGFFTPETDAVRHWLRIAFTGMTLDDLGAVLAVHGTSAEVHHADEGASAFFAQARANLETPGDLLVVNYSRARLGQGTTGNIAPVAAWDEASDRYLVLDAAAFRWPPVWARGADLFAALDTVDGEVDRKRGWVVVRP